MRLRDWPLTERPRERILDHGAERLSEAELLALLLGTGSRNPVELARELLLAFGGLRGLLHATPRALRSCPGLGPARVATLLAVPEIAGRYLEEKLLRGDAIGSPDDTRRFLIARLRDLRYELFCALYLDNRHRVIRFEELFRGTIDGTSVYPREVARAAIDVNAAAVILAHNHPSGVAEPSSADERITRRLKAALELLDIRLLDHLIVGDGEIVSLAARGLL